MAEDTSQEAWSESPEQSKAAAGTESGGSESGGTSRRGSFGGYDSGWGLSDTAAESDGLGFDRYVSVLKRFLAHENTVPPLTVSLEGEWGTGKSSFMAQLRGELEAENPPFGNPEYLTVEFNPWRHEQEDAVWAAFMLSFFHQLVAQLSWHRRWRGHLRLAWFRYRWSEGWRGAVRLALVVPLLVLVVFAPQVVTAGADAVRTVAPGVAGGVDGLVRAVLESGGVDGGRGEGLVRAGQLVAAAVVLVAWSRTYVADPVEKTLRRYIAHPEYRDRVSFVERFHREFGRILDAYVTDQRVFVFVDDLDRCILPRAAELMQSINLMISSDSRTFFVLGMDREKVAAGIAARHGDLLPYLYATERRNWASVTSRAVGSEADSPGRADDVGPERPTADGDDRPTTVMSEEVYGLELGDDYLEKFIQIPFAIPKPNRADIEELVGDLTSASREGPDRGPPGLRAGRFGRLRSFRDVRASLTAVSPLARPTRKSDADVETDVLRDELVRITGMVAAALDNNPRMVKTFVNLFRLRAMLATELGLFGSAGDGGGSVREGAPLTLEQLGKFVAMEVRWPVLVGQFDRDPTLLSELVAFSESERRGGERARVPGAISGWPPRERARLVALLDYEESVPGREVYTLEGVNVRELLRISPRVERTGLKTEATSAG